MFTLYLVSYTLLAILGIAEIATGFLKPIAGLGTHIFLALFTVIFIIQTVILVKSRAANQDTKSRTIYSSHRLTLVLATFLVLLVWLFSI
jgi:ABC-type transport system involved in cytochrome bd biosynthesis fused ATPase/permease subunit